jgi:predicted transcriptional regulator of viral defense system
MGQTHLSQALARLRAVFRAAPGAELVDTEVAQLAGIDDEECPILLEVLEETGAIERLRSRVYVCRPSSWWSSAPVRS